MTKAETIRFLHFERCSPPEIAEAIGWPVDDVIRWMESPRLSSVRAWKTGEVKEGRTAYELSIATGRSQSAVRSAAKRQGIELEKLA